MSVTRSVYYVGYTVQCVVQERILIQSGKVIFMDVIVHTIIGR